MFIARVGDMTDELILQELFMKYNYVHYMSNIFIRASTFKRKNSFFVDGQKGKNYIEEYITIKNNLANTIVNFDTLSKAVHFK